MQCMVAMFDLSGTLEVEFKTSNHQPRIVFMVTGSLLSLNFESLEQIRDMVDSLQRQIATRSDIERPAVGR